MDSVDLNAVFSLLDAEKQKMLLAQVLSSNLPLRSTPSTSRLPANPSPNSPAADSASDHDSQENQQNATSFTAGEMLSSSRTKTAANKYFKVGILQVLVYCKFWHAKRKYSLLLEEKQKLLAFEDEQSMPGT